MGHEVVLLPEADKVLWRLELPLGWRALYTTTIREKQQLRVVILFIGTHKQYERLMGY